MKNIYILILVCLYPFTALLAQCASQRQADSLQLVAFYNATGGPNWADRTNWLSTQPLHTWHGITMTPDGCAVRGIWRFSNNLTGTLPNLNLPKLTNLDIYGNRLTGIIPDFSNLPKLTNLDIYGNRLTGIIPDFSNLPKLTNLDISGNNLTGIVPDFSNLPNLLELNLSSNQLTSIPDFSNLPKLTKLALFHNQLTGSIPDFSNLPKLTELELSNNRLTGSIPDFSNLPKLMELALSNNQLTGSIPNFSNLPDLESLYLSHNQLTGSIPDFSNLPNLKYLDLYQNQLTGSIPHFSNVPLKSLNLFKNGLTFAGMAQHVGIQHFSYAPQDSIPTLNAGSSLYVEAGGTPNTYRWYDSSGTLLAMGLGDNTFIPPAPGYYRCEVTNSIATALTLYSRLTYFQMIPTGVEDLDSEIEIPNIISANGDGIHDFWEIKGLDLFPENSVEILNLSGVVVFKQSPYQNLWRGDYNGQPLPQGTYIYLVTIPDYNQKTLTGLLIIR